MNKRFLSVLLFAVVVAGLASLVLYFQLRLPGPTPESKNQILVATRQLEIGTVIKEGDVKLIPWAVDLPTGAMKEAAPAIKRGVISTIYASEPILDNRLAPEGAGGGLAATIPKGMRAVGIKVDQVISVGGFVVPGMRVDVIVASSGRSAMDGVRSKVLLQNIEVLSAGQNIQRDAEGKPVQVQVVNVLVSPEQAERLTLASAEARLQLVLRNPLDTEEKPTPGASVESLFGEVAAARPVVRPADPRPVSRPAVQAAPPPPPKPTVQVIHGTQVSETTIDSNLGGAR